MIQKNKILLIVLVILYISVSLYAHADSPHWAKDVDIDDIDIAQVRLDYSIWGLLSDSGIRIRSRPRRNIRADIEAYFVNPITYIHLLGRVDGVLIPPEELEKHLSEIYSDYFVFYVILKSEENEKMISHDDWEFSVVIDDIQKELVPANSIISDTKHSFGYSGAFFERSFLLFFNRKSNGNDIFIDVLSGDYIVVSNREYRIREEMSWIESSNQKEINPLVKTSFKLGISLLCIFLFLLCFLSKPPKEWSKKK